MEYIELQYKSLVCSHLYQKILKHIPPIFTDNEKQSYQEYLKNLYNNFIAKERWLCNKFLICVQKKPGNPG